MDDPLAELHATLVHSFSISRGKYVGIHFKYEVISKFWSNEPQNA